MRYQQQQRQNNKTERQKFEYNIYNKSVLERKHTDESIKYLRALHKSFAGKDIEISLNKNLEWNIFFKQAEGFFNARMKSNQIKPKGAASQTWKSIINSFKRAINKDNNRLYKNAIGAMNAYPVY